MSYIRTWTLLIPARAAGFAGFTGLTGLAALVSRSRPDAVLAMSPPLTLGAAGWLAARAHRVPFVFNIQDVFPDVAVELGAITDPRVIRFASWLERETYLRSDAVTVLSDDLRDNVAAKIAGRRGAAGSADKVRVIPNFIDTDRIRPAERENAYRREFGLEGKTVVMYAIYPLVLLLLLIGGTLGDHMDRTEPLPAKEILHSTKRIPVVPEIHGDAQHGDTQHGDTQHGDAAHPAGEAHH